MRLLQKSHCRVGGNLRHHQTRHTGKFRVDGVTCTGTGDSIADVDVGNTFANTNNRSRAAVTESAGLVETAANGGNGGKYSVTLHFADDFAHQVGAGFRFLQQILAGKFGRSAFRPGRNQRSCDAN